jgi:hypothetical protein
MTDKLNASDLRQFTGTERWYRHGLVRNVLYTEGVQFLAEKAGAYWLVDEIALANKYEPRVRAEEFQAWTLTVTDTTATLSCDDGNGNIVLSKHIAFTDFPLETITLYFTDHVILLPSEY